MGACVDRRSAVAGLLCLLAAVPGCMCNPFYPATPLMAAVPRKWRRQHAWGPEANDARARGELRPRFYTARMAAWADLGRRTIRTGDILFRLGQSNTPLGNLVSGLVADVCDSPFSHDALAVWEGDTLYVYDAEREGIRKVPFDFWMLDVYGRSLVVKRLRPELRGAIPAALAYCEDAYRREVPYDTALRLDDERLYCSELIEKAFRSGGVCLSDPMPIRSLPRYRWYWLVGFLADRLTEYRVDEPIFVPGNERYGTFASPCLEAVYEDARCVCRRPHWPSTGPPVPCP
jgi:hypothetical protein